MLISGGRALPPGRRPRLRMGGAAPALAVAAFSLLLAAPASAAPATGRPVALVLVPDLVWSTAPSSLDGFAKASLSMRTAPARAGAADVYLTLGKGGRSAGLDDKAGVGRIEPLPNGGLQMVDWVALQARDKELRYGGTLGSVGEALRRDSRRWGVAGQDQAVAAAAATAAGTVPNAYPGTVDGVERAVDAELDAVFVVVSEAELPVILQRLERFCTLVVSGSTPDENRHLGVLAASPPCGLGQAGLRSPSTHHAHLATLPDVSATLLELTGVPVPTSLTGGGVTAAGGVERESLVERDRRTWTADRSRTPLVWLFVGLNALGAIAAIRWPRARAMVASALLAIPAASFLMMIFPWWRAGAWGGLVVGGILAALIAIPGTQLVRRDAALGVAVLAAVTSAVIAVDALFGSPLQIDAPFGNSPVVAGRFFGVGNIGSGFLVAGLLVAGGVAIDRGGVRSVPWVAAALALAVVVGAAPQFGADVGGVLFAIPAYGLLLFSTRKARVGLRQVLLLAAAALVAVGLLAAVDLVRSSDSQTHLAKRAVDGGLTDDIVRKGARALQTVKAPMANLVLIAAAALALTRFSPGPRRALRGASYAVVVAAVLGSLLNDSGLNVAAAVAAVAWPAGVAVASPVGAPHPPLTERVAG